jgi:hypothetical protein
LAVAFGQGLTGAKPTGEWLSIRTGEPVLPEQNKFQLTERIRKMSVGVHMSFMGPAPVATRYNHPDRGCGSSVQVCLQVGDNQFDHLKIRLDAVQARELGQQLLDLADDLTGRPWEHTPEGKAWAAAHPKCTKCAGEIAGDGWCSECGRGPYFVDESAA